MLESFSFLLAFYLGDNRIPLNIFNIKFQWFVNIPFFSFFETVGGISQKEIRNDSILREWTPCWSFLAKICALQFQYFLKDPVKYDVKYQVPWISYLCNFCSLRFSCGVKWKSTAGTNLSIFYSTAWPRKDRQMLLSIQY